MEIAQKHSTAEQQRQAQQYNKRIKGSHLSVGDRVVVANKGERGKRKLADKWEDKLYTVVSVDPSIHVYKIKDAAGRIRVVHRNLLMEVNFLPVPGLFQSEDNNGANQSLTEESDPEDHDDDRQTALVPEVLTHDVESVSNSSGDNESQLSCAKESTESDMTIAEEIPLADPAPCTESTEPSTVLTQTETVRTSHEDTLSLTDSYVPYTSEIPPAIIKNPTQQWPCSESFLHASQTPQNTTQSIYGLTGVRMDSPDCRKV
ncbi:hypothetical protein SRHO_G00176730 [Serrasalmus rhombeus]